MKKYIHIILVSVAILIISCSESFLDIPPTGVYSEANLNNEAGVNKLLVGAYSKLNGDTERAWNFGSLATTPQQAIVATIHGGEAMKGSNKTDMPWVNEFQMFKVTTGNDGTRASFIYLFDAIDKCNLVLKVMAKSNDPDFTEAEKLQIEAEVRFLRAHYYFYLKRMFKNVPWIDETISDPKQPNTLNNDGATFVNVWPQIAADMDFARKNLNILQTEIGRPNKWAADCYYAKILIYRANEGEYTSGYTEALEILNDVMDNGVNGKGQKYGLLPNFYHNFSAVPTHKNSVESVWAVQHTVNDNSTTSSSMVGLGPNGNQESRWMATQIATAPGWGSGWGFYQASQWWVDHFRVKPNGLPYLDMYATNPNTLKNDMGIESTDPSYTPDTSAVDPRLDWSVGRRGIPFYDYGLMPGKAWIRNQADGGPYLTKKWYVKNSQAGVYTPSKAAVANAINYCVIRYSDVLLLAAECNARLNNLDVARDLVNEVRNRMLQNSDSPDNWVKLNDGITNAANYKIGLYPDDGSSEDAFRNVDNALDAILYERTLELGTEGHRFYDVVRFGKGEEEFNAFLAVTVPKFDFLTGASYTDIPDAYLPLPTQAIDNSLVDGKPTLTQNPGY